MKMNNIKAMVALGVLALASTSCENGDWDFPDFEYSTTYFAYQGNRTLSVPLLWVKILSMIPNWTITTSVRSLPQWVVCMTTKTM